MAILFWSPRISKNETAIALRAVRDKNLVVGDVDLAIAKIVLGDCRSQEFVALLRAVTAKGLAMTELIHRAFHRVDRGLRQRFSHVADAAANQFFRRVRILFAKFADAARDLGKEIAGLKLQIIFV